MRLRIVHMPGISWSARCGLPAAGRREGILHPPQVLHGDNGPACSRQEPAQRRDRPDSIESAWNYRVLQSSSCQRRQRPEPVRAQLRGRGPVSHLRSTPRAFHARALPHWQRRVTGCRPLPMGITRFIDTAVSSLSACLLQTGSRQVCRAAAATQRRGCGNPASAP